VSTSVTRMQTFVATFRDQTSPRVLLLEFSVDCGGAKPGGLCCQGKFFFFKWIKVTLSRPHQIYGFFFFLQEELRDSDPNTRTR
jgi:hypothetical protein